jgi:hypothetical protein
MLRHTLKIRWAGPAVALALLGAAVPARAVAAPTPVSARVIGAPPVPCVFEAAAFGNALYAWYQAFAAYMDALPGGTESEISDAAQRLDQATGQVVETGGRFLLCIAAHLE